MQRLGQHPFHPRLPDFGQHRLPVPLKAGAGQAVKAVLDFGLKGDIAPGCDVAFDIALDIAEIDLGVWIGVGGWLIGH